jgi:hypothetical protein
VFSAHAHVATTTVLMGLAAGASLGWEDGVWEVDCRTGGGEGDGHFVDGGRASVGGVSWLTRGTSPAPGVRGDASAEGRWLGRGVVIKRRSVGIAMQSSWLGRK